VTSAAESLVNALVVEGTKHVFGIPGTQNLPILDVLRVTPSIRFVLTRHEQAVTWPTATLR
jgi:thiamine pyrophosphate-dependent acetolactate synthase large subunit-like protein